MTKQEAIERAWTLLEVLEALPNGVDITVAEVRCYSTPLQIHLNGGIDRVARKLGKRVAATAKNPDFIHRGFADKNCEYVQLYENAAPSDATTGDGKA